MPSLGMMKESDYYKRTGLILMNDMKTTLISLAAASLLLNPIALLAQTPATGTSTPERWKSVGADATGSQYYVDATTATKVRQVARLWVYTIFPAPIAKGAISRAVFMSIDCRNGAARYSRLIDYTASQKEVTSQEFKDRERSLPNSPLNSSHPVRTFACRL